MKLQVISLMLLIAAGCQLLADNRADAHRQAATNYPDGHPCARAHEYAANNENYNGAAAPAADEDSAPVLPQRKARYATSAGAQAASRSRVKARAGARAARARAVAPQQTED